MEWRRLGERVPDEPVQWCGELPDYEFSVDTRGNVKTSEGAWIENPQHAAALVERVRGRAGGRFRITPQFNLVIVYGESPEGMIPFVAGQLGEPFRLREDSSDAVVDVDTASLKPGSLYPGPTDRKNGAFKIRQKRGGVIERKQGSETVFALIDESPSPLVENGRRLMHAWKTLSTSGLTFYVNDLWHAWYQDAGEARFLASVPGGFMWPMQTLDASELEQPKI
jgi:hypothetical protein